jgi:hypothetical protein
VPVGGLAFAVETLEEVDDRWFALHVYTAAQWPSATFLN